MICSYTAPEDKDTSIQQKLPQGCKSELCDNGTSGGDLQVWTGKAVCTFFSVSAIQPAGKGHCAAGETGLGWAVKLISCKDLNSCCTSLRVRYDPCFLEKSQRLYSVHQSSCLLLPSLFLVALVTPWAHRCC